MEIVIDTSALIAVIVGEPERDGIIEMTRGHILIGPGSIPWEVGNAFSAMFKQKRITLHECKKAVAIFKSIPVKYCNTDFVQSMQISKTQNLYAYDAYFLDCSVRYNAPLLTLDAKLAKAAKRMNIKILEA